MSKKINELLGELNSDFLSLVPFINKEIEKINQMSVKDEKSLFSNEDTILITYADQFNEKGKSNFESLNSFMTNELKGVVNTVHILPFYPWTSDDGFSPIDYKEVKKEYGTWEDVEKLSYKKMYDCVYNHISSESPFFKKALEGDEKAMSMFHIYSEKEYSTEEFQENIKKVVRPRTHPLFSEYIIDGKKHYVWTTFSKDQIDTNLNNVDMLKYILESFFLYIQTGARFFRVDAVPFMWKELGTNCSHLEKTHKFVQLIRAIIDSLNLNLYLVTESNVPHQENITYWGNGENEAHIIYNFSLSPLILHGLTFKTNQYLNKWASEVFKIGKKTTYLNFTASHDGIGMRGLEGIVPEGDIDKLCHIVEKNGGRVGKKRSRDGSEKPYELNITWASFLKDSRLSDEENIRKVVNSHAIVMFFPGIGAHYVHNFLGSENWQEGLEESGIPRRLNRKKFNYPLDLNERENQIKNDLVDLIAFKNSEELFRADKSIRMINIHEECLCFERYDDNDVIRVYMNLSDRDLQLERIRLRAYELKFVKNGELIA